MNNHSMRVKEQLFNRWAPFYDCIFTSVFYQAAHQRLLEFVELSSSPQILDIGCGTGRLLHRLAVKFPHLQGVGLDLSAQMIAQAQQRNLYPARLSYQQGNAESLPFSAGQFEAVFSTISFLHYPHPQVVLAQIERVLRPGGRFYLVDTTITQGAISSRFNSLVGVIGLYSRQQREQMGQEANLLCQGHHYLLGPVLLTIFRKETP